MNKPVAWMSVEDGDVMTDSFKKDCDTWDASSFSIPLYTHPAELTDEEIKEAMEFAGIRPSKEWGLATTGNVQLMIFAKAILRKASEK